MSIDKTVRFSPRKTARIVSVFGTRPEIIKFSPVIDALEQNPEFETINICTSQQAELATSAVEALGVRVDYDLKVMQTNQQLNVLCGRVLELLDPILQSQRPDMVLVQGDTTSALAGALAASNRSISVGHIEAGLRSHNAQSPFPEEMNRVLIDRVAKVHFAATSGNRDTLISEGASADRIFLTGNPVVDAVNQIVRNPVPSRALDNLLVATEGSKRLIVTSHRRENIDQNMAGYFESLARFVNQHQDVSMILPVHPNPNVQTKISQYLSNIERIHLVDPMSYGDFIQLLTQAWLIVSDSGGIQEEAPTLSKPLLIIRENTERPESVECGVAKLVGRDPVALYEHLAMAYQDDQWEQRLSSVKNPFGDGDSGNRIVTTISHFLFG